MPDPLLGWDLMQQLKVLSSMRDEVAGFVPSRFESKAYRGRYKHPRARKIWIKSRPLQGIRSRKTSDIYNSQSWLHWALEVGPWTIEVHVAGKSSSRLEVRRTHHSECHDEWEEEADRVCVGETTMSDQYVEIIRQHVAQTAKTYDVQSINCQGIAATLAVLVSDDGFATWDALEHLHFFSILSLLIPLVHLEQNYETSWEDPRMYKRGMSIAKVLVGDWRTARTEDEIRARTRSSMNSVVGNLHQWSTMIWEIMNPASVKIGTNLKREQGFADIPDDMKRFLRDRLEEKLTKWYSDRPRFA